MAHMVHSLLAESDAVTGVQAAKRSPIVYVKFQGTVVDKGKDDPTIFVDYTKEIPNTLPEVKNILLTKEDGDTGDANKEPQELSCDSIPNEFLQFRDYLQSFTQADADANKEKREEFKGKFLRFCSSCLPLLSNEFLAEEYNEQLQMHLGGSLLVLYPMMSALLSQKSKMKEGVSFSLGADNQWEHEAIATKINELRRVKWKPKNDAWLKLNIHHISAPVFVFEHKCKMTEGKARRKAILTAQLCWRRLYLAVCVAAEKGVRLSTNADEMLSEHLVWFAALEGSKLFVGAVRGVKLENPKRRLHEVASFEMHYEFTCSYITIQVLNDMARAVSTMYDLFNNYVFSESLHEIIRVCSEARIELDEMARMERDGREALSMRDTTTMSTPSGNTRGKRPRYSSDQGKDSGPRSSSDQESGSHAGSRSNRSGGQDQGTQRQALPEGTKHVTAIEHFAAALLEGVVEDLKFFPPAIPLEAFNNPYLRFRGDNLFYGKTVREKLPVFVKCFWGRNEIRRCENELEMLRTVRGCPYVQDLIHHGIDYRRPFAVLVTRYAGDTWTPGGMDKVLINDLRSIGRQVLQALVSLHKKGIIHRDVKPGNICVSANGRATLIDFGLSIRGRRRPRQRNPCNDERPIDHPDPKNDDSPPRLMASEDSDNSSYPLKVVGALSKRPDDEDEYFASGCVGTEGYMAPEVVSNKCFYSCKVDVYGLGKSLEEWSVRVVDTDDKAALAQLNVAIKEMTADDPLKRCSSRSAMELPFFLGNVMTATRG